MIKTTLNIDGMACGMCEAHVNNAIRNAFKVKKVTASHKSGLVEILSEAEIDNLELEKIIGQMGNKLLSIQSEPYVKKGLFGK